MGESMPQIIALASSKGGPGKTTLAQILLASLAADGVGVAAIDADPTGALSRWVSTTYEGPAFPCHHETDETGLANLVSHLAQQFGVVVVDTAGFGNQAAAVAMTAADLVLIPMLPGEADVTEAERTVQRVQGLSTASRRDIASKVVLNRVQETNLSRHAATEAARLPRLQASLSSLTAYGEISFSGRLPAKGKPAAEIAALLEELQEGGWLPAVKRPAA
jgi:chromosome partitioning protein